MSNICNTKSSKYCEEIHAWGGYLFTLPELDIPFCCEPLTKIYSKYGRIIVEKLKSHGHNSEQTNENIELSVIDAYQLRDYLIENLDELTYMMAESEYLSDKARKALEKFQKVYYEDSVKKLKDKIKELEEKLSKESSEVSE